MNTKIILLRGVTPAGKNKVPMAPLRSALESAGLENVRTYIQSGNIIASTNLGQASLERLVHDVIQKNFGGDITVFARPIAYFKKVLESNPFNSAAPAKLYFTFLSSRPEATLLNDFAAIKYTPDNIKAIDDVVYIQCATKYSDIRPNNNFIERKLKVAATTRVYNTVSKLIDLEANS